MKMIKEEKEEKKEVKEVSRGHINKRTRMVPYDDAVRPTCSRPRMI